MNQQTVDFDSISNLAHRAVLKALLETSLSTSEICKRLNVSYRVVKYAAEIHLPPGFLGERKQRLYLERLRASAAGSGDAPQGGDPAPIGVGSPTQDGNEVTVISLPAPSASGVPEAGPTGATPPSPQDGDDSMTPKERVIYDFLTTLWERHGRLPGTREIAREMAAAGKGKLCASYLVCARRKWLHDRGMTMAEAKGTRNASRKGLTAGHGGEAATQATLTAEMGGMRITLQCGPSCGAIVGEVLRALRGAVGAQNG